MTITLDMAVQALQLLLILGGLLVVAVATERWINWLDKRALTRSSRPKYSTASAKRIEREVDNLWRGSWRDTMPPAEPTAPQPVHKPSAQVHKISGRATERANKARRTS